MGFSAVSWFGFGLVVPVRLFVVCLSACVLVHVFLHVFLFVDGSDGDGFALACVVCFPGWGWRLDVCSYVCMYVCTSFVCLEAV